MSTTTTAVDQLDLASVDLFDMAWRADGPPHALFGRMRAEAPVHWNPFPDGTGCWSVTRHADIAAISRDTETFSSQRGGIFLHPDQVLPLDVMTNMLLYMDPPGHTRYRLILQKAFTPHTVATLEDGIRARVTKTIDRFAADGRCDLVDDLAIPVPLGVLTELMGVPESDIPRFFDWTERVEASQRDPEPNTGAEVFGEMVTYIYEQIQRQAAEGNADSLVMKMKTASVDGEQLTDLEIVTFFGLLAFAGNDTTRNTAATGLLALLEHPEALQELYENPALIDGAVEEILRWTCVVQWFARTATRDTELGGQAIREGDRVVMWYGSASRDEALFSDPDRFDIHRRKSDHKAFGGGGRHFCLGAGLARLELRIVLEEVLRRLRDLQLAGDVVRLPSNWAHGLVHLPATFTPAAPAGS
jgi:cytochrome P450